jgi:hypothetical protein
MDGDGLAELLHVWIGGNRSGNGILLDIETCKRQPFAVGVPYLAFWDYEGISLFDKQRQTQNATTELMRAIIDQTNASVTGRQLIDDRYVNLDDYLRRFANGAVRTSNMDAIRDLNEGSIPPQAWNTLEMLKEQRRESGGGAIDTAAQAMQVSGDTAHGVERTMSAMEQVNMMVARTLGETLLKSLYMKAHAVLRENWEGVMEAKVSGSWLSQVPQNWQLREDVTVSLGLTSGERSRLIGILSGILAQQKEMMGSGMDGIMVTPANIHNTLVDIGRLGGLNAVEQYWVDPASQEGQQAAQQKQQAAQQQTQEQQQAAMMQMQGQTRMMVAVEEAKNQGKLAQEQMKQMSAMQQQMRDMMQDSRQFMEKMELENNKLRLQLMELNAKYDDDEVPDQM